MILKTVINPDQERNLIALKGYKIERHDFGAYRNQYHNKAEWVSDWQDGVLIGQYWYRVEDAIRYLYPDGIVLSDLFRETKRSSIRRRWRHIAFKTKQAKSKPYSVEHPESNVV